MIPDRVLEVMLNGYGHFGSTSNNLIPAHIDTLGASSNPENDEATFFVRKSLAEKTLTNLDSNGMAAVYLGLPSHEAYQIKGHFIGSRDLTAEELETSSKIRNYFIDTISAMGLPRENIEKLYGVAPDIGLSVKIENIYIQTPGPEAGTKLEF